MKIEYKIVAPKDITPYLRNPRINDHVISELIKSFKEYGFIQPINVDENMEIITGHTRWKAATKAKLKEITIQIISGWSKAKKVKCRIADNKYSSLAFWDMDLLKGEFIYLRQEKEDLSATGFTDKEIDQQFGFDILENPSLKSTFPQGNTYGGHSFSIAIYNIKSFIDNSNLYDYIKKLSSSLFDLYGTNQKDYNAFGVRVLELIKKNETKLL